MMRDADRVKERIERALEERVFPGGVFALVTKDSVAIEAFGRVTYKSDAERVAVDTIYDLASISKIIGPMAIAMQLVDEGVIALDDLVVKQLPLFGTTEPKRQVKVVHLLTYTVEYDLKGGSKSLIVGRTPQQLKDALVAVDLSLPPGTSYRYSNVTAFLVTQLIERVTGKSLRELFDKRIKKPLDMRVATWSPETLEVLRVAPTEITDERGVVRAFVHDESAHYLHTGGTYSGAAGLFATAEDVAKFVQVVLNNGVSSEGVRLFSDDIQKYWVTDNLPELLPMHTPLGWGDGNNALIDEYDGELLFKSGFTGCFMCADLKKEKGFVLLSNRTYPKRAPDAKAFEEVWRDVMKVVLR